MGLFDNCLNSKMQGDIAESLVVFMLLKQGWTAHLSQVSYSKYDILLEKEGRLFTVQVKSTRQKAPSGLFCVTLKTCGGNQSASSVVLYDNTADYLAVVTAENVVYLIPKEKITVKNQLTLTEKLNEFILK